MSTKLTPTAQSLLVCRDIIQDRNSPTTLLINPTRNLNLPAFPAQVPLFLFAQVTGGLGTYRMSVQLQDDTGAVLARVQAPTADPMTDPVAYYQIVWRALRLKFPHPGSYALVLLADDEEIGRHALDLTLTLK